MAERVRVEVAYAERDRQFLRALDLPIGATVQQAIDASGLAQEFAIDVSTFDCGVWSRAIARDALVSEGDRVELYRPLQADPKDSRRRRAEREALPKRKPMPRAG